jgi:DNA-binding MarR family transcriptional regulator
MTSEPAGDEVPIPALMRSARGSYAQSIRASLAAEGISDIPRNGSFVLVSLANGEEPVAGMIRELGVTKQAASQLIDTLVLRGYLTRDIDPADRRRVTIDLTDRGHAAAAAIYAGTVAIDAELAGMLSPAEMTGLRAGLAALGQIKERGKEAMMGPRTRLTEFSPVFGVKDLTGKS